MLTVAYCRVSTDEQAAEGFSIEGQADKLRAYGRLHELGEVVVVSDPGLSGKRPEPAGVATGACDGRRRARGERVDLASGPALTKPG